MKSSRFFLISVFALSLLLSLSACSKTDETENIASKISENMSDETITNTDIEQAKKRAFELVSHYKDIYKNAKKTTSPIYGNQEVLNQETVDEIENLLSGKGYPVFDSDSKYPTYLKNSDNIYAFWKDVLDKKNTNTEIISILLTGELYYTNLKFTDGKTYKINVCVGFDNNNEPTVITSSKNDVHDLEMINDQEFYYQVVYPPRVSFDDYALVRLKPVDKDLYDLTLKYLFPVAYINNNLFVTDWDQDNFGNLSFNDTFEYFYYLKTGNQFDVKNFETVKDTSFYYTKIPSELFQDTVKPYFDVSLENFRKLSLYDSRNGFYPWQEVGCDNAPIYPDIQPEVVQKQDNNDGTFTLTVNVRCNDYKTDKLFTHEVKIRPLPNGNFQYLSNKITYKSEHEMPPDRPRLPSQRK